MQVIPAGSTPAPDAIVDAEHLLIPWLRRHRSAVTAVRPDAIVYAAATHGADLPSPPFTQARHTPTAQQTPPSAATTMP